VEGEGFHPDEALTMESRSEDETMTADKAMARPISASNHGSLSLKISPNVQGKKGGAAKLTLKRKNNNEVGTLYYYWGTEAAKNKG
jgi:hypothetical protein